MGVEVIELNSVKGKNLKIFDHMVAQLSFGSIRTAEYDGAPCFVKYFSSEDFANSNCGMRLYENLKAHLLADSPDESFLWPIDLSNIEKNGRYDGGNG